LPLLVILSEAGVPQGGTTAESKDPYIGRTVGTATRAFFPRSSPVILRPRSGRRTLRLPLLVILSEAGVPQGGTTAESKDPYDHDQLPEITLPFPFSFLLFTFYFFPLPSARFFLFSTRFSNSSTRA